MRNTRLCNNIIQQKTFAEPKWVYQCNKFRNCVFFLQQVLCPAWHPTRLVFNSFNKRQSCWNMTSVGVNTTVVLRTTCAIIFGFVLLSSSIKALVWINNIPLLWKKHREWPTGTRHRAANATGTQNGFPVSHITVFITFGSWTLQTNTWHALKV